MTVTRNFEHFQYFNFETNFLENKDVYLKSGVALLVESSKIKSESFFAVKTAV